MAEGPDFAAGVLLADERIVLGNGVRLLAGVGMIDVDPQDRAEQVADVLAGCCSIGDAAAVAGGEVEIAVRPEPEAAAVVPAGGPFEDDSLALGVGTGGIARSP